MKLLSSTLTVTNLFDIHIVRIKDTMHEAAATTAAEAIPNRRNSIKFSPIFKMIADKVIPKDTIVLFFKYKPALKIVFTHKQK
jgi:hypothetical protein